MMITVIGGKVALLNRSTVIANFATISLPSCEVNIVLGIDGDIASVSKYSFDESPDDETQVAEMTLAELDRIISSLQAARDVLDPA